MNKRKSIIATFGLVIFFVTLLVGLNGVLTEEFLASKILNERDKPIDIATAFAVALRLHHPIAYETSDPAL